jgi:site-specific DNA-methyltransferase (adenine-specific)
MVVPGAPDPFETLRLASSTHRFHLGDCCAVLPALDPGSVDVVVTSPPYNLGVRYRSYADTLPRDRYLEWTDRWIGEVARVLSPEGSLFLNVGAKPTDPWTAFDVAQVARNHLQLQNVIHWIKSIAIDRGPEGELAVGHYKPINSDRFLNDCHEFIFHFTPNGKTRLDRLAIGVPYQDASNIGRWRAAAGGKRCRGNTWFLPYDTIQSRDRERPHPATFPPRLPEYCIRLHGIDRARLVLDPFVGLGSTGVACARLGIDFLGIEMDRTYLEEAVTRARAAAGQATGDVHLEP